MLGRGEDAVARDLASGASRRRNRDAGGGWIYQSLPASDDFQIVEYIAWIGEQRRDRLSGIEDAAPANRHHEVRFPRRGTEQVDCRLRRHGEIDALDARCDKPGTKRCGALPGTAGDDDGAPSERPRRGGYVADSPFAEQNTLRRSE